MMATGNCYWPSLQVPHRLSLGDFVIGVLRAAVSVVVAVDKTLSKVWTIIHYIHQLYSFSYREILHEKFFYYHNSIWGELGGRECCGAMAALFQSKNGNKCIITTSVELYHDECLATIQNTEICDCETHHFPLGQKMRKYVMLEVSWLDLESLCCCRWSHNIRMTHEL